MKTSTEIKATIFALFTTILFLIVFIPVFVFALGKILIYILL